MFNSQVKVLVNMFHCFIRLGVGKYHCEFMRVKEIVSLLYLLYFLSLPFIVYLTVSFVPLP